MNNLCQTWRNLSGTIGEYSKFPYAKMFKYFCIEINNFLKFFKKFILEAVEIKEIGSDRDSHHLLIHFPNSHDGHGWTRDEAGS